jgi:transcriptional regulator
LIIDTTRYSLGVDNQHNPMKPTDLIQGMLDLLILRTLQLEPLHGWAVAQRIRQISNEVLQVQQGSLYPALHRLEAKGWIRAEWGASDKGKRAKFYSLTSSGRRQLGREKQDWSRLSAAIALVLEKA